MDLALAESFGPLRTIRESRGTLKEAKADFSEALSVFTRLGDERGQGSLTSRET